MMQYIYESLTNIFKARMIYLNIRLIVKLFWVHNVVVYGKHNRMYLNNRNILSYYAIRMYIKNLYYHFEN